MTAESQLRCALSTWTNRIARWSMLLRAPLNFALFHSYRWMVFDGMLRGEALIRVGLRQLKRDDPPPPGLELVWGPGPPAVTVLVSSVNPLLACGELEPAFALMAAVARTGVPLRILCTVEPPVDHELQARRMLEARFGAPAAAQCRIDIVDAATRPPPCGPNDVYVAASAHNGLLLGGALARRGDVTAFYQLPHGDGPGSGVAPHPKSDALDRVDIAAGYCPNQLAERLVKDYNAQRGGAPPKAQSPTYDNLSGKGLGYRILKAPPDDFVGRRVCLFVHFDPHGRIDPHVAYYLKALKASGIDLLLISSCDLDEGAIGEVEPILLGAICRQNFGLDFSGWALALELFPGLTEAEAVIIANDSVYGPVGDLSLMLDQMRLAPLDVWGVAESFDGDQHFQSWFVCFGRAALKSEVFRDFWAGIAPLSDKWAIISNYELVLRRQFASAGLRVGSLVEFASLGATIGNPTMVPWRQLLDRGAPFVKVQLLRDNPVEVSLNGWIGEIGRRGYPVHLILDHLRRVEGQNAAALQTR